MPATRIEVSAIAFDLAKSYVEDCRRFREFCDKAKDINEKIGHHSKETQKSMVCFIFCEICLEAYINTYAGDRLSKLVWEKLERLNLNDKWIIVPELIFKKTFETEEEPYKSLKWLVEKRNFIVHYKGKFRKPEINRLRVNTDRVFKDYALENAERALQLVKDMIRILHSFDGSEIPFWLVT